MSRRFWICLGPSLLVMLLAMVEMIPVCRFQEDSSGSARNWVQWVLATPVVLWGGWPFFQRGVGFGGEPRANMFTLIAMGTGAA